MPAAVLDPSLYSVVFGGVAITGFAGGEAITAERVSELTTSVAGIQGDVAVAANTDRRVTVTITLLQTSSSNDYLSGIVRDARNLPGSIGQAELVVQDVGGTTLIQGSAYIRSAPAAALGQEVGTRAWVIECVADTYVVGGNA